VVLPEYVGRHWWDRLLYNQTARRLRASLVGREHTVILDVPYRRSDTPAGSAAGSAGVGGSATAGSGQPPDDA
jgi:hypothetical protein